MLRDYQIEMLDRLRKAWKMVQMPTGTGKTHLMAALISEECRVKSEECPARRPEGESQFAAAHQGSVLVVAHRRELIEQISQTLNVFGIEHGLIVSGKPIDETKQVQVASIQTLARRGLIPANAPTRSLSLFTLHFSLVIVDEAHHALADTYRMLWEWWPKAKFLGLTATPCRLNNAPFTDLFQTLLQSWTIQEFIDKGWLSDFEYVSAAPNSEALRRVRSLTKRGADGDFQTKELATVMDVPESIEHLYKTYRQFADGKKGIVYAIDRQHAQHIAEYYKAQGVRCAVIDAKTPAEERRKLIESLTPGPSPIGEGSICQQTLNTNRKTAKQEEKQAGGEALDVLVNVDIFSEGFDCPEVEFIQLARPTLSLSKYLQQVGRGMRISEGKPHVLILDNVGLYQTFGLPTEERDWRQTFFGLASGKGDTKSGRYVVLDEPDGKSDSTRQRELVNLEMVRIKKGGQKHAGLQIFLKDGRYGVLNNGKVSCQPRFKEIVRLHDEGGYFAAGIYGGKLYDNYVEYASLIDSKGIDQGLRLFRDVEWRDGIYYSSYKPRGYKQGDFFWFVYWDPKGNCYYDDDPAFRKVAGVEVAEAREHNSRDRYCFKLRYNTGSLSPRFDLNDVFYNKNIIIARDYLVVKKDKNHAYHICGYLDDAVIVQTEDMTGYQKIGLDGRRGDRLRTLPNDVVRISPISYLYYVKELGLRRI